MEDSEEMGSTRLDQPPAPRRSGRKWFLIGGLAFAFMLALGVGAVRGLSNGTALAAALGLYAVIRKETLLPATMTEMRLVAVFVAALLMASISALLSLGSLRRADPADVF